MCEGGMCEGVYVTSSMYYQGALPPIVPPPPQLRDVYLEGQSKRYELKVSVLSKADEMISKHPEFKRQGHLLVHEKKGRGECVDGG